MAQINSTHFELGVVRLFDEFVCSLDERRGDDWLSLFSDQGYYAVLRRVEYEDGNNVLIVGEDMKRLRARMSSALERDLRRTVHVLSGIRSSEASMTCAAAFAVWFDGLPMYAGRYVINVVDQDGVLRIAKCSVVLDNKVIESPIYFPI